MIKCYREKPVIIQAAQYKYPADDVLNKWLGDRYGGEKKLRHFGALGEMVIMTLKDGENLKIKHIATEGDYIIKGIAGEFYACRPDIFERTYDCVGKD